MRIQKQNWKAFKGILEGCHKQFQNSEVNHLCLFKIKCIENLLPTVKILNSRKPHLYKNSYCKRCSKENETISHLVTCEKAYLALEKIEKEAWKQLYEDKRKEKDWNLINLQQVFQSDYEKKLQKRKEWLRGILHEEDAEKIKAELGSERMMIKFWSLFWHIWMELVYKEIWKKRCKDTEAWEKKESISKKEKFSQKEKGKKRSRKEATSRKSNCRIDENTENCNISLKIALDSINSEVKKGIIANWI